MSPWHLNCCCRPMVLWKTGLSPWGLSLLIGRCLILESIRPEVTVNDCSCGPQQIMYQTGGKITQLLYPLVGITVKWMLHKLIDSPRTTKPKLLSVATAHEHSLNWLLLFAVSHSLTLLPMALEITSQTTALKTWSRCLLLEISNLTHTLRPRKESLLSMTSCFLGPYTEYPLALSLCMCMEYMGPLGQAHVQPRPIHVLGLGHVTIYN